MFLQLYFSKLVLRFDTPCIATNQLLYIINVVLLFNFFCLQIFILTIVIFSLNVYVTRATSLDPVDHVEMEQHTEDKIDGSRNRRSGEFFSSLLKKKFGLISTLTGVSAGKAMGNPVPEHYEQHEPLVSNRDLRNSVSCKYHHRSENPHWLLIL